VDKLSNAVKDLGQDLNLTSGSEPDLPVADNPVTDKKNKNNKQFAVE
jgi:hypothetical protein